ncbi:MAG: hypothetical protein FWF88_02630 [Peptococcaceae bacterium]|nr:hypothetical protein [Peptococcaceae bacterium]
MEKKRKSKEVYLLDGWFPTDNTNTARQLEIEYDFAEPAPRPTTKTRSKSAARRRRQKQQKMVIRALVTSLAFIVVFGAIAGKAAGVHLIKANQVNILVDEIQKLSLENEGLKRNVDLMSSVKHIEQAALAMGMVEPEGRLYVENNLLSSQAEADVEAESKGSKSEKNAADQAQAAGERSLLEKVFSALITVIANQ